MYVFSRLLFVFLKFSFRSSNSYKAEKRSGIDYPVYRHVGFLLKGKTEQQQRNFVNFKIQMWLCSSTDTLREVFLTNSLVALYLTKFKQLEPVLHFLLPSPLPPPPQEKNLVWFDLLKKGMMIFPPAQDMEWKQFFFVFFISGFGGVMGICQLDV